MSTPIVSGWIQFASALRKYDEKRWLQSPEAIITQMMWSCLAYVPDFASRLGLPAHRTWHRGGHGEGDIRTAERDFHVEVKAVDTQISMGAKCPRCTEWKSQLEHMAEDGLILMIAPSAAVPRLRTKAANLLPKSDRLLDVLSMNAVSTVLVECLANGAPRFDPWECLLDVEV